MTAASPPARPGSVAAPSAWAVERALSIANEVLSALVIDAEQETDGAALLAVIQAAGADIHKLVQRLCLSADEDKHSAKACKEREEEIEARRRRFERHEEVKRTLVLSIIQALPEIYPDGKYKDALVSASVRVGQPGVVITDETALSDEYVRITRTPDKAAIRADLLQGAVLPGAELRNPQPFLSIKVS